MGLVTRAAVARPPRRPVPVAVGGVTAPPGPRTTAARRARRATAQKLLPARLAVIPFILVGAGSLPVLSAPLTRDPYPQFPRSGIRSIGHGHLPDRSRGPQLLYVAVRLPEPPSRRTGKAAAVRAARRAFAAMLCCTAAWSVRTVYPILTWIYIFRPDLRAMGELPGCCLARRTAA